MQWTTGDLSDGFRGLGGIEALAGINAGDGYNSYTIPGSQTPIIVNITQTSNIGVPGVWIYNFKCMYCINIHCHLHSYMYSLLYSIH